MLLQGAGWQVSTVSAALSTIHGRTMIKLVLDGLETHYRALGDACLVSGEN